MLVPVCICGLPGSGNRLVRRLLCSHGFDLTRALIKHFPPEGIGERFPRAVVPVRRPDCWYACVADQSGGWQIPKGEDIRGMNAERVARIGAEWHPRDVLFIQYEMILRSPAEAGDLICSHAGVEFVKWPEPIVDGNVKRLREIRGES